jgi:hypothetical protein
MLGVGHQVRKKCIDQDEMIFIKGNWGRHLIHRIEKERGLTLFHL